MLRFPGKAIISKNLRKSAKNCESCAFVPFSLSLLFPPDNNTLIRDKHREKINMITHVAGAPPTRGSKAGLLPGGTHVAGAPLTWGAEGSGKQDLRSRRAAYMSLRRWGAAASRNHVGTHVHGAPPTWGARGRNKQENLAGLALPAEPPTRGSKAGLLPGLTLPARRYHEAPRAAGSRIFAGTYGAGAPPTWGAKGCEKQEHCRDSTCSMRHPHEAPQNRKRTKLGKKKRQNTNSTRFWGPTGGRGSQNPPPSSQKD